MSDPITKSTTSSEDADLLCKSFMDALKACLSTVLGPNVDVLADASPSPEESTLWFQADFAPIPDRKLMFGGDRLSWLELGKQLLAAPGIAREGTDENLILSALEELAGRVVRSIESALPVRLGHDLTAKIVPPATVLAAAQSYPPSRFRICIQDLPEIQGAFLASPQLRDLAGAKGIPRRGALAINAKNLELLMDVEMPVSISFGRAQLALKDVIKLTTGSIVELNRSISEPVDIIVNNCTVARGEVVVVEGNFGVRIKEVLSKEDRLKRLF